MSMLKPCPKCGSTRYVVMDNNYWFFCRDCGYSCPVCGTLEQAIEAWNSADRAEDFVPDIDEDSLHEYAGNSDQSREADGASP